jgi:ATP-dependent 26S proteasome regulatory subunit
VVEDVDLIAEDRGSDAGRQPLLFQLLNEMDGLGEDVDVAFILTTNRVELLEPALVARPGRVDQAIKIALPDVDGRRRLLGLYRGDLDVRADLGAVLQRTEGVTASFLKELMRRCALAAAEECRPSTNETRLVIDDRHFQAALDELLDDNHQLTRRIIGGAVP